MEEQKQQKEVLAEGETSQEQQEEESIQMEPTPFAPSPSYTKLIIAIVAVFVLGVAGLAGAYFFLKQNDNVGSKKIDQQQSQEIEGIIESNDPDASEKLFELLLESLDGDLTENMSDEEKQFYSCSAPSLNEIFSEVPPSKEKFDNVNCQVQFAQNIKDISICSTFSSKLTENDCFRAFAISNRDINICLQSGSRELMESQYPEGSAGVTREAVTANCYRDYAIFLREAVCDMIPEAWGSNVPYKDYCYASIAVLTGSSILCHAVERDFVKNKCLESVNSAEKP